MASGGKIVSTAFGIDFGTTNTRIAYFDGEKPIVVPVYDKRGKAYQIPSVVGYRDGRPASYGEDALVDDSVTRRKSLKWLAASDAPVLIDGHPKQPEEILRDFFVYLKKVVAGANLRDKELNRASICVPVKYPYRARETLLRAVRSAGIDVVSVYHEPVAALYCHLEAARTPGYAAVFDWGGGTLDTAVVHMDAGWAHVLAIDGIQRGGDDFDKMVMHKALADFVLKNPDLPVTAEDLVQDQRRGFELRRMAEQAKKNLDRDAAASLSRARLVGDHSLEYHLTRQEFESWIEPDVEHAVACLRRTLKNAQVPEGLLGRLLLSGGTSRTPLVQARIMGTFGPGVVATSLPGPGDEAARDVANATAIGAAMLSVWGAKPVFAREVGIRLVNVENATDQFLTVFPREQEVALGREERVPLFVTDASTGVARILLCDRLDPDADHQGCLMRILTVPVDREEKWVDLWFSVDQHLVLKVRASGRIARAGAQESQCFLPNVAIGFQIPQATDTQPT